MTCPNCRFAAPETELCPNCGAALTHGAAASPASPAWALETTGAPGGCLVAILLNLVIFFGGAQILQLSRLANGTCVVGRVGLAVLAVVSLAIIVLGVWRSRKAGEFWFALAFVVFVPFLPCSMWFVAQGTNCPSR